MAFMDFFKRAPAAEAQEPEPSGTEHLDSFENANTGINREYYDARYDAVPMAASGIAESYLLSLFRRNGIAKRIIKAPVKKMLQRGIKVEVPGEEDLAAQVLQYLDVLQYKARLIRGCYWSRLYGGGGCILGIDDGQPPTEPVNEKRIKSIRWLLPVGSNELDVVEYYEAKDIEDTGIDARKYGQPKMYAMNRTTQGGFTEAKEAVKFHESRFLRFDFEELPDEEMRDQQGWGDSSLMPVYDTLRDASLSFSTINILIQNLGTAIFKIGGLTRAVASDKQKIIHKRLHLAAKYGSVNRVIPLDADNESFERQGIPLAGVADLLNLVFYQLATDTGIPVSILAGVRLGQGGIIEGAQEDLINWYASLTDDREYIMREPIERLCRLVLLAKDGPSRGREPDNWKFEFLPIWEPNEKEKVEIRKIVADTDAIGFDRGWLSEEEVRSHWTADGYSIDLAIDHDRDLDIIEQEPEPSEAEALQAPEGETPPAE